ncbi:unnamed protein product [Hapterophycus canaliculatus]
MKSECIALSMHCVVPRACAYTGSMRRHVEGTLNLPMPVELVVRLPNRRGNVAASTDSGNRGHVQRCCVVCVRRNFGRCLPRAILSCVQRITSKARHLLLDKVPLLLSDPQMMQLHMYDASV